MQIRWLACFLLGLCSVQSLRADTIVLRSGEHIQGQIVGETASDVSIRRKFKSGNIYYVDKIGRANIARIERSTGPAETAEPASAPTAARSAGDEPEVTAPRIPDKPLFLAGAIQKFENSDYQAAGLELSRLIISSSPGELQRFTATVQERLGISLAELTATAHLKAALERARGRGVTLRYVTEYEKPALIPMLEEVYERAITMQVGVAAGEDGRDGREAADEAGDRPPAGAGARPAGRNAPGLRGPGSRRTPMGESSRDSGGGEVGKVTGRGGEAGQGEESKAAEAGREEPTSRPVMNIKSWLDRPADFNGDRVTAAEMEVQIYHARSLLRERIRLDPQVRTDKELKEQLTGDRVRLDALLKAVKARAGGALTPQEREAQEARIRNQWDAFHRERLRRQTEALSQLQRIIEEQQRPQQPLPGGVAPRTGDSSK